MEKLDVRAGDQCVLEFLAENESTGGVQIYTYEEIANETAKTAKAVSGSLYRLRAKGLIQKHPTIKTARNHGTALCVTNNGRRTFEQMLRIAGEEVTHNHQILALIVRRSQENVLIFRYEELAAQVCCTKKAAEKTVSRLVKSGFVRRLTPKNVGRGGAAQLEPTEAGLKAWAKRNPVRGPFSQVSDCVAELRRLGLNITENAVRHAGVKLPLESVVRVLQDFLNFYAWNPGYFDPNGNTEGYLYVCIRNGCFTLRTGSPRYLRLITTQPQTPRPGL